MAGEFVNTTYGRFSSAMREDRLADLCVSTAGVQTGPFGSQLHQEDYVESGTPIITVEHLGENRIIQANLPSVTDDDRDRLSKYQMQEGDIIFSRVGSVDRRALVRSTEKGWLFSGRCLRVRPDRSKIDPAYLAYFFGLPSFKAHIRSIAVGATMPSLNTQILSDVPIIYPPNVNEQRAIAHILGTLDDKIELNRRMNETLDAIARAMFKSWFVDFDPVRAKASGEPPESICRRLRLTPDLLALFPARLVDSELGEIPEGWEVRAVGDVIERLSVGKKYEQKTVKAVGKVPVLDQGKSGIIGYHDDEPGVAASTNSPVAVFANHTCYMRLIYFPFSAIQNVLPFVGKDVDTIWVFQATFGKQAFIEYKGHWPDFVIHKIVVPDSKLSAEYSKVVHPMLKMVWAHEGESNTLSTLRDALLPKLLSGELRVPVAGAA